MDRLHRTRLLFGDAATKKMRAATVMVVGCGAVGSFAIEALARTGIGHIIVVDFDNVEPSNINRQLFALDTTAGTKDYKSPDQTKSMRYILPARV